MRRSRFVPVAGWWSLVVLVVLAGSPTLGQAPKYGGRLTLRLREDLPQGFAIHETATISTMWPAMPCFSNLVLFDPLKTTHRMDAIIGELAERWSWQNNDRSLVFFLRTGVRWHDGKPLSSKDVKFTFDLLREAPDAPAKLRINPRRDWYANLEAVEAVDPQTVAFRLKRPQPSLLLMLASGYTPIYAAHVPPASYRTGCVGTGPFKLKEWRKGEFVEYVKNPDYFVKGRPYLAGLRYLIIGERGTATAALQAGRVDTAFPGQTPKPIAERLRKAVPQLVMTPVNTSVIDHLVVNTKKPPFDNAKVRLLTNPYTAGAACRRCGSTSDVCMLLFAGAGHPNVPSQGRGPGLGPGRREFTVPELSASNGRDRAKSLNRRLGRGLGLLPMVPDFRSSNPRSSAKLLGDLSTENRGRSERRRSP